MKIVLNRQGINEVLRSSGVAADLKERADRVAQQAGTGMLVVPAADENRARYIVVTSTAEAINGEHTDRRLTRAIDAAR